MGRDMPRGGPIGRAAGRVTGCVDGRVAGLWWAEADDTVTSRVVLEPFAPLRPQDLEALTREGESLATFVAAREPDVYRRYRHSRRRA